MAPSLPPPPTTAGNQRGSGQPPLVIYLLEAAVDRRDFIRAVALGAAGVAFGLRPAPPPAAFPVGLVTFRTLDEMARAAILTGELGRVYGAPIVVSEVLQAELSANGLPV